MNDVLRIKRVAEKLVEKYGTSDPFQICAALDIEVRYSHLGSLSGYYCVMHRIPYIVLNSTLNSVSSRIICAHELGHDRLHRRLARGGILTDFDIF
ncbi:MAG: hypothetical protein GX241_03250 [Ruminococcaceae bacterium]|nr:hypothetical protein [Oscillospiraceae bacterium]